MKTLFLADWLNVVFMHFRADAAALQKVVPLEVERFDGNAYISFVAFTQSRLRFAAGGRVVEPFTAPLARHEFFNVRTYVRDGDRHGIFFLAEWIPNRLAVLIGPRMYGLPYRLGRLRYRNDAPLDVMTGTVSAAGRTLAYEARPRSRDFTTAKPGTLDAFLLERYTAYTHRSGVTRRFDVSHDPWPHVRADATVSLNACPFASHYSPGVHDIAISAPSVVADRSRTPAPSKSPPASRRSPAARECHIP
jgi:uncharacterized protein